MLNQASFESSWEYRHSVHVFFYFLFFVLEVWNSCSDETALLSFYFCQFPQGLFSRDQEVLKQEPGLKSFGFHLVFHSHVSLIVICVQ